MVHFMLGIYRNLSILEYTEHSFFSDYIPVQPGNFSYSSGSLGFILKSQV